MYRKNREPLPAPPHAHHPPCHPEALTETFIIRVYWGEGPQLCHALSKKNDNPLPEPNDTPHPPCHPEALTEIIIIRVYRAEGPQCRHALSKKKGTHSLSSVTLPIHPVMLRSSRRL